jgi:hypothetical protein
MKRLTLVGLILPLALLLPSGSTPAHGAAPSPLSKHWSDHWSHRWSYHWPIKPFDRQHPVRGVFGDPRTLARFQRFGLTRPGDSGHYSFHSGIDIVAPPGTPVYPVVSGRVVSAGADRIVVVAGRGRSFGYWHLRGNVHQGQSVVAERTVLGWTRRPFDHVHFAEHENHRFQNPLAPGHLEPYADHTTPHATGIRVGVRSLAIAAVDEQAMPVPGSFDDLPQAPALVEWRLEAGGSWGAWQVAADFRRTIPARGYFWAVYADGTYQNAPVFNRRLYSGTAGQYLFLTGLDPSRLGPGDYEIEARVTDIRGNSSTRTWPLAIGPATG